MPLVAIDHRLGDLRGAGNGAILRPEDEFRDRASDAVDRLDRRAAGEQRFDVSAEEHRQAARVGRILERVDAALLRHDGSIFGGGENGDGRDRRWPHPLPVVRLRPRVRRDFARGPDVRIRR